MKCMLGVLAAASIVTPASATSTTSVTETFDGNIDQVTWRLGFFDTIVSDGRSSGPYLRNPTFDAAVPSPVYVGPLPTPLLGDYRAAGVVSVGLDVNVFAASIGVDHTRSIALVLSNELDMPDGPDDCAVFFAGRKPLPSPGSGWRAYDFRVPSDSAGLPPGWNKIEGTCGDLSEDAAWNRVITNVTKISFPFSDPGIFWYFQVWDLGLDNVRVDLAARR